MRLFPAIDIFNGKAVRLLKGDYQQMTVYSDTPRTIADDFIQKGAKHIHLVDLEGAKSGETPNLCVIADIIRNQPLFSEVGGGIRSMDTIQKYLDIGISRVILGTAAVKDPAFLEKALAKYEKHIAVGVDSKNGFVAIHGWTEQSQENALAFCKRMQDMGVDTLIVTDISKDGAMQGTNRLLYQELSETLTCNITASGGVSDMEDVKALSELRLYGAIIGKAYYTGAIDLQQAIAIAGEDNA